MDGINEFDPSKKKKKNKKKKKTPIGINKIN